MTSEQTPNEIGEELEANAKDLLAGKRVPQSGAGKFLKLDLRDGGSFVYSCKATKTLRTTAMRAIALLWREAISGTRGFQGHGDGAKPGMIFELDGEVLVLTRLTDHVELATNPEAAYIPTDKATERRKRGMRSLL